MALLLIKEFEEGTVESKKGECPEFVVSIGREEVRLLETKSVISLVDYRSAWRWVVHWIRSISSVFLPVGFPDSVGPGYWEYQVFDSLQGLCSYLRGVVSSAHVLRAAGVGNQQATSWSAAMTWALKDGMGMMGGLFFSAWAAPLFDSYVKEFRFFADLINNVGLTLDMLAPAVGASYFLWIAAASTLCKTMCGMSAGATKGSITQHFAIAGNLADLHAKEGTQETLISLIGMTMGILLARYFQALEEQVSKNQMPDRSAWLIQWSVFAALTFLHVWTNYRAVHVLRLRTLNRQRAFDVLRSLVENLSGFGGLECLTPDQENRLRKAIDDLPGPQHVMESLSLSVWHMVLPSRWSHMVMGARLVDVLIASGAMFSSREDENVHSVVDEFQDENYLVALTDTRRVMVSLLITADTTTELQAFIHALLIQKMCEKEASSASSRDRLRIVKESHMLVKQVFMPIFSLESTLQRKGWDLGRVYLGYSRRRSQWSRMKTD